MSKMSLPCAAAEVLKTINSKSTSLKTAIYNSPYGNKKQLMSLVCECLKFSEVLGEIIDTCNLTSSDKRFKKSRELALVVLHRHVFGKGFNGCFTKYKKVLENQKSAIHSAVVRVKLRRKITDLTQAAAVQDNSQGLPRYVRVNTLVSSLPEVISSFISSGYTQLTPSEVTTEEKWVSVDPDIDNLLVLPPNTDLHSSPLLQNGSIIIQDKASCLPAYVLNPPTGSHVIDSCAAPGNKTSHLAALLNNTGSITAFELNKKRCKVLRSMLSKAKVTCCRVENADFTGCDVSEYTDVEYILVDPSCSGSGITGRWNSVTDDTHSNSDERLKKLSSFQSVILKKALSFPKVKKVVYSTCSIHSEENEQVVQDVLTHFDGVFTLEKVLPNWKHRGENLAGQFLLGENCVRASPETTKTIGFFLAMFTRVDS